MESVVLHGRTFVPFISATELEEALDRVAVEVTERYRGKDPLFIGVLNGAYFFASELLKRLPISCSITFVKVASYHGMQSSGQVADLIGLNEPVAGRHVVVLEDIVDTGSTVDHLLKALADHHPASVSIATMLFKPEAYTKTHPIDHVALRIPNAFVVGSGLDHDGLGRNLPGILRVKEDQP